MEIFNKYFENLVFTRVEEKEGFVIYGAGIAAMFGAGVQRYILLFIPSRLAFKNQAKISELSWQNLQTRSLTYSYKLKAQPWNIDRDGPDILLNVIDRTKNYSAYKGNDFPFEILLLHDPKKKTPYQHYSKITLSAAVETFNAVFNYIGKSPPLLYTSEPEKVQIQNPILPLNNWFQTLNQTDDDSFELL
uniref:Uncharacterized protein n=1 Tax=Marseillevirus LCMAC102 TaxID=2506603 RepID=A0A481YTW8_9VIRU|nr:MAG: uncharacterized protein LCMAC102_03340 [Marseillevirus LCMAC102]